MGLESGDTILSLNGYRLNYHGSWNDALQHAVYHDGGYVQLRIRDVRTGHVAFRQTYIGDICGPIVQLLQRTTTTARSRYKSRQCPAIRTNTMSGPEQIKQLVELFD